MLLSFAGAAFAQTNAGGVDTSSPDVMIKTVTTQVLDTIRADKSIRSGDINRITEVVNKQILPYTDFRRTTQLAMGRAWRQATPEQQDQMVEQFKMLLIRTYAGALSQFRDQQVADAKAAGLKLMLGMNFLDGGDGSSGIPGTYDLSVSLYDYSCSHAFDFRYRTLRFDVQRGDPAEEHGVMALGGEWEGAVNPVRR